MSKSEEWQEPRLTREAFDPAQLREGAISTGGIGGCPGAGFGYLTPTTFGLAPQAVRPATAGLRRKAAEHDQTMSADNAAARLITYARDELLLCRGPCLTAILPSLQNVAVKRSTKGSRA
jgi:hypothetical protein